MQKLLTIVAISASLLIVGCSAGTAAGQKLEPTFLERLPIFYRQDIQQGNIVTQEMVNQLKPGMNSRQVRFIMGTPLLIDVFHQERWDYIHTLKPGRGKLTKQRLSLFFEGDALARIEGDMQPDPNADPMAAPTEDSVISVPDNDEENKGVIERALDQMGLSADN